MGKKLYERRPSTVPLLYGSSCGCLAPVRLEVVYSPWTGCQVLPRFHPGIDLRWSARYRPTVECQVACVRNRPTVECQVACVRCRPTVECQVACVRCRPTVECQVACVRYLRSPIHVNRSNPYLEIYSSLQPS
jgi:hypothetical protein